MIYQDEITSYFIDVKAHRMPMTSLHCHSSYELYYLDSGTREYYVKDRFFSVAAGSFVLIPPSTVHRTEGSYANRVLIGFTHDILAETYTPDAINDLLKCFSNTIISPPEDVLMRCKALLNILNACDNKRDFAIYLGNLLCELSKCPEKATYNEQMSALMKYINTHFAEIDSIEQIAEHFFISKYHLCRIFKTAMGLTIIEYLNDIKIKSACEYLTTTNKSIQEISVLCGFNSAAYFSNVFKKLIHMSPNKYRKSKKKI